MSEKQRIEEKYRPNRQLERYKASVMRGGVPTVRKERAVARYAAALKLQRQAVDATRRVADSSGVVRPAHRRLLDSLARACAGSVRLPAGEAELLVAEKAAKRVAHGIEPELVFRVVAASFEAVGVPQAGELLSRVRARVADVAQKPEEPAPRPQPSVVGTCAAHAVAETFARELEQPSELEEFQRKKATETLKLALQRIKPWARQMVVDRVGRRKTSAQLAEESGMPLTEVERIIAEARAFVRKYTNYFDDDWFWSDTCTQPKLLPGQ